MIGSQEESQMAKRSKTGKRRKRRTFTAEQKAEILRRHIKDKEQVSDLCEEYDIQPSVFYDWQNQLLERMESVLNTGRVRDSRERQLERKVEALEQRLAKKDNVIAEISEEYVQLKKELGEP